MGYIGVITHLLTSWDIQGVPCGAWKYIYIYIVFMTLILQAIGWWTGSCCTIDSVVVGTCAPENAGNESSQELLSFIHKYQVKGVASLDTGHLRLALGEANIKNAQKLVRTRGVL